MQVLRTRSISTPLWMSRYLYVAWLLTLVWPAMWALDREPPLRAVSSNMYLPPVPQGDTVLMEIPVMRETWRECTTQSRKFLTDSAGVRFDFGMEQVMTAESLSALEKRMGPWIKAAVRIPETATTGPAVLSVEAEFICNPIHRLWPIHRTLSMPVEVLPSHLGRLM